MEINEKNKCKDFRAGDIVTAYRKGIHRITSSAVRGDELVEYVQLLTENGKKRSSKVHTCHVGFCKKVSLKRIQDERYEKINEADRKFNSIKEILDEQGYL